MKYKTNLAELSSDLFNLRDDTAEPSEIHKRIAAGASPKGTNLYVLMAAILIASIGLNVNSTAVIIGAMLISPLMGGIIGLSYGLATKQSRFIHTSLLGLGFQVAVSLITSTIYFAVSPINTAGSELLARTSPTVWDVIIALFGGAAGIIGQTRKDKDNNIIPGVAISTAIMPPLCTAGYGLANGKWDCFLQALDLFFINCLCIFVSAFIILKFLKINDTPDDIIKPSRRLIAFLVASVILILTPSGYYAYKYVCDMSVTSSVNSFVAGEFNFEETQVISSSYDDKSKAVKIAVIGKSLDSKTIHNLNESMGKYGLESATLKITQTEVPSGITKKEVSEIVAAESDASTKEIGELKKEIAQLKAALEKTQSTDASVGDGYIQTDAAQ